MTKKVSQVTPFPTTPVGPTKKTIHQAPYPLSPYHHQEKASNSSVL